MTGVWVRVRMIIRHTNDQESGDGVVGGVVVAESRVVRELGLRCKEGIEVSLDIGLDVNDGLGERS